MLQENYCCVDLGHFFEFRSKKVVLFPEIDRVKKFLSLTRPHSQMCIRIYIFSFKQKNTQTNSKRN